MEWMLFHCVSLSHTHTHWNWGEYFWQYVPACLRQSSVHIERNTSPPVTTQHYRCSSVCVWERWRCRCWIWGCAMFVAGIWMSVCSIFICICVCGEELGRGGLLTVQVVTAVLNIRQVFTEIQQLETLREVVKPLSHTHSALVWPCLRHFVLNCARWRQWHKKRNWEAGWMEDWKDRLVKMDWKWAQISHI